MRLAICADQLGGTWMELLATDLGKSREQLCARGTLRDSFELGEEVVRKRAALQRRARLEPSMHGIWHVADLDHLRHVYSMFACAAHVKGGASTSSRAPSPDRSGRSRAACAAPRARRAAA